MALCRDAGFMQGFPCGSVVKNPPAMQGMQEMRVRSLGREEPSYD